MELTLVKSLHSGYPDMICNAKTCNASARHQPSALQVLYGLHPSAVHVCSTVHGSCNTCTWGSHVTVLYVEFVDIRNSYSEAVRMALFYNAYFRYALFTVLINNCVVLCDIAAQCKPSSQSIFDKNNLCTEFGRRFNH